MKRTTLESRMAKLGIRRPRPTRLEGTDSRGGHVTAPIPVSLPSGTADNEAPRRDRARGPARHSRPPRPRQGTTLGRHFGFGRHIG